MEDSSDDVTPRQTIRTFLSQQPRVSKTPYPRFLEPASVPVRRRKSSFMRRKSSINQETPRSLLKRVRKEKETRNSSVVNFDDPEANRILAKLQSQKSEENMDSWNEASSSESSELEFSSDTERIFAEQKEKKLSKVEDKSLKEKTSRRESPEYVLELPASESSEVSEFDNFYSNASAVNVQSDVLPPKNAQAFSWVKPRGLRPSSQSTKSSVEGQKSYSDSLSFSDVDVEGESLQVHDKPIAQFHSTKKTSFASKSGDSFHGAFSSQHVAASAQSKDAELSIRARNSVTNESLRSKVSGTPQIPPSNRIEQASPRRSATRNPTPLKRIEKSFVRYIPETAADKSRVDLTQNEVSTPHVESGQAADKSASKASAKPTSVPANFEDQLVSHISESNSLNVEVAQTELTASSATTLPRQKSKRQTARKSFGELYTPLKLLQKSIASGVSETNTPPEFMNSERSSDVQSSKKKAKKSSAAKLIRNKSHKSVMKLSASEVSGTSDSEDSQSTVPRLPHPVSPGQKDKYPEKANGATSSKNATPRSSHNHSQYGAKKRGSQSNPVNSAISHQDKAEVSKTSYSHRGEVNEDAGELQVESDVFETDPKEGKSSNDVVSPQNALRSLSSLQAMRKSHLQKLIASERKPFSSGTLSANDFPMNVPSQKLQSSPLLAGHLSRLRLDLSSIATVEKQSSVKKTPARRVQLSKPSESRADHGEGAAAVEAIVPDVQASVSSKAAPVPQSKKRKKKEEKGYAELSASIARGIIQHFANMPISMNTLPVLENGCDLFWEKTMRSLTAYAEHAGRNYIDVTDVELYLYRLGFAQDRNSLNALLEKYLPLEWRSEVIPVATAGNEIIP